MISTLVTVVKVKLLFQTNDTPARPLFKPREITNRLSVSSQKVLTSGSGEDE